MSLSLIEQSIQIANRSALSVQAWRQAEEIRAEKVARFRRYADGDHDNHLTVEQKRLLNIRGTTEDSTDFNDNLCSIILDTMLDRIQLTGVRASDPVAEKVKQAQKAKPAPPQLPTPTQQPQPSPLLDTDPPDPLQEWADELLERNRIDGLQVDVHEAALRDGNTYLMVYADVEYEGTPQEQRVVCFSHEPAYDGSYGMVVLYETTTSKTPMLAVKVWNVSSTQVADTVRVNVYYDDRIERYAGQTASGLKAYSDDGEPSVIPWVMPDGTPIGVPIIHFRNRGSSAGNFGLSELENVLPLQDASNVVLTSLVATALLSGFPIRLAVGFDAPADVVPGRIISAVAKDGAGKPSTSEDASRYHGAVRIDQFEVADLSQLIGVAQYLKGEMYAVTNTPTDDVAADASGEARKQSEVKLIGKVKRFEVRNGNAWEDAVRMAARVQAAFAADPSPLDETTRLTAQWADPEVRNDSKFTADMLMQYEKGVIDQRTYLEAVAAIYDYDKAKIDEIIQRTDAARSMQAANVLNQQDANNVDKLLAGLNGNGAANGANQPVS